jgi:hypothetical protein
VGEGYFDAKVNFCANVEPLLKISPRGSAVIQVAQGKIEKNAR